MGCRAHYVFYKSLKFLFNRNSSLFFGFTYKIYPKKIRDTNYTTFTCCTTLSKLFFGYKLRKKCLPLLIHIVWTIYLLLGHIIIKVVQMSQYN